MIWSGSLGVEVSVGIISGVVMAVGLRVTAVTVEARRIGEGVTVGVLF
jgi:hypothetical protein